MAEPDLKYEPTKAPNDNLDPSQEDITSFIEKRNKLLGKVNNEAIRRAWFTLSHLVLDDGAQVVDMGCGDGSMTYAMAAMNPKVYFTGLDKSQRNINKAKETFQLHNLDFKIGDASSEIFAPGSLDAVVNYFILHEVYSNYSYNDRIVSETLAKHFRMLKDRGVMFIWDYALPPPGDFILMEMPDKDSKGEKVSELSDPDLLVWYSEHARPRFDAGMGGFFLEELDPRREGTRLFRLPYKWAYEFVMRKDSRAEWEKELPLEYTFFTEQEFLKQFEYQGARISYAGNIWNEEEIAKRFEGKFRLLEDDDTPLGPPPTGFVAVAMKMEERKSLNIIERRPSNNNETELILSSMEDEKTGRVYDIVRRDVQASEVLPYRIDEDGRLKIYLHEGVARSIVNAVARSGHNLSGRKWSGHMIEPYTIDSGVIWELGDFTAENSASFADKYLGLKSNTKATLEKGPAYYPAPDYIDERIYTYYLRVEHNKNAITPKHIVGQAGRFLAKGVIREMDAQQVLNAITVGMIPNARLELQILALFEKLKLRAENWTSKELACKAGQISENKKLKTLLKMHGNEQGRFRKTKNLGGTLRPVHSIFVEEGQEKGADVGLSYEDVDFIIHDKKTINTAVVLPLTKGLKSDVHAGFLLEHLPVPARHNGSGLTMTLPSINLPPEIKNIKMAKEYLADQLAVVPDCITKMGESYFSHMGVTPQRIHPFAMAVPADWPGFGNANLLPFYQMLLLKKALDTDTNTMVLIARAYRFYHDDLKLDMAQDLSQKLQESFGHHSAEASIPLLYDKAPILPTGKVKGKDVFNADLSAELSKRKARMKRLKYEYKPSPK